MHVGVDETGQHESAPQVDHRLPGVAGAQQAVAVALNDRAVAHQQAGIGVVAQRAAGERVLGRVEDRAPVERHRVVSGSVRVCVRSRSNRRTRSAATFTAIVTGCLPVMSASPIGVVIRSMASVG